MVVGNNVLPTQHSMKNVQSHRVDEHYLLLIIYFLQRWCRLHGNIHLYSLTVGAAEDRGCGGLLPGSQVCSHSKGWPDTR